MREDGNSSNMIIMRKEIAPHFGKRLEGKGKYHLTPSGPVDDSGPHDVHFLITTPRYQQTRKQIIDLLNSALVSDTIKLPLSAFVGVVDDNMGLMTRMLDQEDA